MFVQNFQRSIQGWKQTAQQAIQVSGHQGIYIRATGQPQGAAMSADYVFVVTGQKQCVLVLSCPQQRAAQTQGTFQQVIQSLQVQ